MDKNYIYFKRHDFYKNTFLVKKTLLKNWNDFKRIFKTSQHKMKKFVHNLDRMLKKDFNINC